MVVLGKHGWNISSLRMGSSRPTLHGQVWLAKADAECTICFRSFADLNTDDDVSAAVSMDESWCSSSLASGAASDAGDVDCSVDDEGCPIFAFDEEALRFAADDGDPEDETAHSGSLSDLFFLGV